MIKEGEMKDKGSPPDNVQILTCQEAISQINNYYIVIEDLPDDLWKSEDISEIHTCHMLFLRLGQIQQLAWLVKESNITHRNVSRNNASLIGQQYMISSTFVRATDLLLPWIFSFKNVLFGLEISGAFILLLFQWIFSFWNVSCAQKWLYTYQKII